MRGIGKGLVLALTIALTISMAACAFGRVGPPAGVAPEGSWAFSGEVNGERVSGTLEFGDPVVVSSTHGRCFREIRDIRRWSGPFGVGCPGLRLEVRVDDDGAVQSLGVVRVKTVVLKEERTTCRQRHPTTNACVAWNTVLVESDGWVDGQVRLERQSRLGYRAP